MNPLGTIKHQAGGLFEKKAAVRIVRVTQDSRVCQMECPPTYWSCSSEVPLRVEQVM
jgi:hypothetical protein